MILLLDTWNLALCANGAPGTWHYAPTARLERLIDKANQLTRFFSSIVKQQDESEV